MKVDNDDFWKRPSQLEALESSRRESAQLHSRAWRRNVAAFLLIVMLLGAVWLMRR